MAQANFSTDANADTYLKDNVMEWRGSSNHFYRSWEALRCLSEAHPTLDVPAGPFYIGFVLN